MSSRSPLLDRLHQALRVRGRSAYWLQRRLQAEGVVGSSTGSISRYMRGEITPPLEFLRAAAGALTVFEPWLISGYGHPEQAYGAESDPEVHRLAEMEEVAGRISDGWAEEERTIEARIADRCWWYPSMRESTRALVRELFERVGTDALRHRYCVVPWDGMQTSTGADLEIARLLGEILDAPVRLLGLTAASPASSLSDDQANEYVRSLCSAISHLLPVRHEPSEEDVRTMREMQRLRQESVERYRERRRRRGRKAKARKD